MFVRSALVAFMMVGSQRTDTPNALKIVELRIFIETTKCPVESAIICGRVCGHSSESPGTMHIRPTNGGRPVPLNADDAETDGMYGVHAKSVRVIARIIMLSIL